MYACMYVCSLDLIEWQLTEVCAKAIVESVCRGGRYMIVPSHDIFSLILKFICPKMLEWFMRYHILHKPITSIKNQA